MQVTIINDPNGKPIGWTMKGENVKEIAKLATIRNLQFFGFNETAIVYNGRKGGNDILGDPGTLSWVQRIYSSDDK
jgi:hypothetical protein